MVVWYAGFLCGYQINPDTPPLFGKPRRRAFILEGAAYPPSTAVMLNDRLSITDDPRYPVLRGNVVIKTQMNPHARAVVMPLVVLVAVAIVARFVPTAVAALVVPVAVLPAVAAAVFVTVAAPVVPPVIAVLRTPMAANEFPLWAVGEHGALVHLLLDARRETPSVVIRLGGAGHGQQRHHQGTDPHLVHDDLPSGYRLNRYPESHPTRRLANRT